jgi:amino acid adenylation domain-containing protein
MTNRQELSAARRALLQRRLGGAGHRADADRLTPVPRGGELELSFAQQRLWFLDQWDPGSAEYNLGAAWRLRGPLEPDALERAISEVVARHEALRTTFPAVEGRPRQEIVPAAPVALDLVDVVDEGVIDELVAEELSRPFDLAAGPLFRARLWRVDEEDHVLALVMHHIVSDGWSMRVLARELEALYGAFRRGAPTPLPPLRIQYADFAAWQRRHLQGETLETELAYWRRALDGAAPVLELPTDRPRPPLRASAGATVALTTPAGLGDAVARLARDRGATPFMIVLAAFAVVLTRYSGQSDVVVGVPVAGRTRPELEDLVGFFVNTMALRVDCAGEPRFHDLVDRVRVAALGAFEHQELPFDKLVEELSPDRDPSRNPITQVMFAFDHDRTPRLALDGLETTQLAVDLGVAKLDLTLEGWIEGELGLALNSATALFDRSTAERMGAHVVRLLAAAAAAPERRLGDLPLIDDAERRQVLDAFNDTAGPLPEVTVAERFERQVAAGPGDTAVVCGGERLTYAALDAAADELARHLASIDVGRGDVVAICVERSAAMIAAVLGVWKAGAAYLPLDPDHPPERLAFVLDDAGVSAVVTTTGTASRVPPTEARIVALDALPASPAGDPVAPQLDDAAYVIYTSGSTGAPKGVVVDHRALAARALAFEEEYGLTSDDVVAQFASLTFDVSVEEIVPTLLVGATLVVRDAAWTPDDLERAVAGAGVSVLDLPAQYWQELVRVGDERGDLGAFASVRLVIVGGDVVSADAARTWQRLGGGHLCNSYGPTETAVTATVGHVASDPDDPLSIGRPIANTTTYVLDEHLRPQPVGVPGELFIGGVGVARGYLNRPALTAERFVPDPFAATPGARLYRTGDLARWRADGTLEFLGRRDHQVKIRGFRIECGEVEAALGAHPAVAQALVLAREDRPGDRRLVAYVVPAGADPGAAALRAHLRERLPDYMVPSAFVTLEAFPLTPNGKVDRAALPVPEGRVDLATAVAPRTPAEEAVAAIWAEVLGVESVGVEDNFFDLGGHSLLATQVVSRIRAAFEVDLPLRDLFDNPTVAALARIVETLVEKQLDELSDDEVLRLLGEGGDELPSVGGSAVGLAREDGGDHRAHR